MVRGNLADGRQGILKRCLLVLFATFCLSPSTARAQQPFTTDNADVTPRRKFHLQIGNEYDILQRSTYPALRQNTSNFEIDYGLLENVEIGFSTPVLAISSSRVVTPWTLFYALTDKMTFDFAIVSGRFSASPRTGLLLGLSVDF